MNGYLSPEDFPTFNGYAGFGDDGAAMRAQFTDGGMRRDYGPKGCAGIVLAPVVLVAALLLRGGRR